MLKFLAPQIVPETCTEARDQNCAVWLVCCLGKFLVQETSPHTAAFYSVLVSGISGTGTVGSVGQMTPRKFTWGSNILTRFFGKKYFLAHSSVDSQQNH